MIKHVNVAPNPILYIKAKSCDLLKKPEESLMDSIQPDTPESIWPEEVIQIVQDLKDTAESLGDSCAGLAANQIWDKEETPLAIFVVKTADGWKEFINPEVITSGKSIELMEGCMSRPGITKKKKREHNATVIYQTLNSREPIKIKLFIKDSFLPIVIQHEYDHLKGKLI